MQVISNKAQRQGALTKLIDPSQLETRFYGGMNQFKFDPEEYLKDYDVVNENEYVEQISQYIHPPNSSSSSSSSSTSAAAVAVAATSSSASSSSSIPIPSQSSSTKQPVKYDISSRVVFNDGDIFPPLPKTTKGTTPLPCSPIRRHTTDSVFSKKDGVGIKI